MNTMTHYIPEVSASKVAALIGMNPYNTPETVMYELFQKDISIKAHIASIEMSERLRPLGNIKNAVLYNPEIKGCVAQALEKCKTSTDLAPILADVEQQAKIVLDLRFPYITSEVRTQMISEVRGKVAQQRGLNNENTVLNTYEEDNGVEVAERNTRTFRKDFGEFKMVGRTDGWVAAHNRIVDAKDRTRKWATVPIYDEVQLRCYMNMSGADESELVERFPDGTKRNTRYLNDMIKWKSIEDGLRSQVAKMQSALLHPEELKRIIELNTMKME